MLDLAGMIVCHGRLNLPLIHSVILVIHTQKVVHAPQMLEPYRYLGLRDHAVRRAPVLSDPRRAPCLVVASTHFAALCAHHYFH